MKTLLAVVVFSLSRLSHACYLTYPTWVEPYCAAGGGGASGTGGVCYDSDIWGAPFIGCAASGGGGGTVCIYLAHAGLSCPEGPSPEPVAPTISPSVQECKQGSIIRIDNQVVSEFIPVLGTPFNLTYSSDRVDGRRAWNKLRIPITSLSVNTFALKSIFLTVQVAGQKNSFSFNPFQMESRFYNFEWDGKDALGNEVNGSQQGSVNINAEYDPTFFNCVGHGGECGVPSFQPINYGITLGSPFKGQSSLGGWGLSIIHYYDLLRGILYLGDGSTVQRIHVSKDGKRLVMSEDLSELYVFNTNGQHIETQYGLTGAIKYSFGYDPTGKIVTITDSFHNVSTINYVGGVPSSIVSPYGQETQLTLGASGYLEIVVNPAGETHQMSYSDSGLLLTFQRPGGSITTLTYDEDGRLVTDENSTGSLSQIFYEPQGVGQFVRHTTSLGRKTEYTTNINGTSFYRTTKRNGLGQTSYGENFVEKGYATSGPEGTLNVVYGASSRFGGAFKFPTRIQVGQAIPGNSVTNTIEYSETVQLSNPIDPYSLISVSATLSRNGKVSKIDYNAATRTFVEKSPLDRQTIKTINSQEQLLSYQMANFTPVYFTYDSRGRIESVVQGNRANTIGYNELGQVASYTNALGQKTEYRYDLAGRAVAQVLPDGREIGRSYDLDGNLASVTPPGRPFHEMNYNGYGYLTSYHPPLLPELLETSTHFFYNEDRQLTRIYRPGDQSVDFFYDGEHAYLNSMVSPNGVRNFLHDEVGRETQSFSEDQYTRIKGWGNSLLISESVYGESLSYDVEYRYNSFFNPSSETLNGQVLLFSYDDDQLLTNAGPQSYTRAFDTGLLTHSTLGLVTQEFTYDVALGEPNGFSMRANQILTHSESYERDLLGRIIKKSVRVMGGVADVYEYSYDAAGRLIKVLKNGTVRSEYTYDSNSNRIAQIVDGIAIGGTGTTTQAVTVNSATSSPLDGKGNGKRPPHVTMPQLPPKAAQAVSKGNSIPPITYDDQDRLIAFGAKTFTYSANGDLTSVSEGGVTKTFVYDVFGNLKSVTTPDKSITYTVDAYDRRMSKKVNGVVQEYYIWNKDNQIIGLADPSGVLSARFVYGSKTHSPDYMIKGGVNYSIVTDHLGSPILVVNSSTGEIVQRVEYDEFGVVLSDSNPGWLPFGFAGCLYDQDTRLCRFGVRDYDASIGRWLSKDPILFKGGDTNLYGYVMQDPINYIDISGESAAKAVTIYLALRLGITGLISGIVELCSSFPNVCADLFPRTEPPRKPNPPGPPQSGPNPPKGPTEPGGPFGPPNPWDPTQPPKNSCG